MAEIGIGIVGGGYMGKAHAIAMTTVAAVFDTKLRPRLEMVAATSKASAERYAKAYGFARAAADWQELVADEKVEAIVIAVPQDQHRVIAEAAIALGKPVLCEKPLGSSLEDAQAMVAAAEAAGVPNMIGFNYIRTPASQYARALVAEGAIGDVNFFRGEMTEDFLADPATPWAWRCQGDAKGTLGDLAPHMINCALAFMGPIERLTADLATVYKTRDGGEVSNDDQAQMLCRFGGGIMGHLMFSRIATGRKMGYIYEITGSKGAIRFDGEDQNALWLYKMDDAPGQQGFRKLLTGPEHPDFARLCPGVGHGTGYQEQITIEAKDFLAAIETGQPVWPTFREGLAVAHVIDAARRSAASGEWVEVELT